MKNRIVIICGHFGVGKTNVAVAMGLDIKRRGDGAVTLIDLDTVNPFFRSADCAALLAAEGIRLIAPYFANTNVDVPSLPPEVQSMFAGSGGTYIVDVGGDDNGAAALGAMSERISANGYEMYYVINKYRPLVAEAADAAAMLADIEGRSGLKAGGIINNSHLGSFTDVETVRASFGYCEALCAAAGLPLTATTTVLDPELFTPEEREKYKITQISDTSKKY